MNCICGK